MMMTNEEIVRDYTQAANKSKQIKILADLNMVSPGEIRAILAQAGVEGVRMPKKTVERKPEAESVLPTLDRTVYDRIETILGVLPENASEYVRKVAVDLVISLFRAELDRWMEKEKSCGSH